MQLRLLEPSSVFTPRDSRRSKTKLGPQPSKLKTFLHVAMTKIELYQDISFFYQPFFAPHRTLHLVLFFVAKQQQPLLAGPSCRCAASPGWPSSARSGAPRRRSAPGSVLAGLDRRSVPNGAVGGRSLLLFRIAGWDPTIAHGVNASDSPFR